VPPNTKALKGGFMTKKKLGMRIAVSNADGEENEESIALLRKLLTGKQLDVEMSPELAAEIAKQMANDFAVPVGNIEIKTRGTVASAAIGKDRIKFNCGINIFHN